MCYTAARKRPMERRPRLQVGDNRCGQAPAIGRARRHNGTNSLGTLGFAACAGRKLEESPFYAS